MAKTRTGPAKRKRIYVARKEAGGDIQISGGVAKIRLTPKVISLFVLLIALAVTIVVVAARQGREAGMETGRPSPQPQTRQEPLPARQTENKPPAVTMAEIAPAEPTAETALNLKYSAIDPEGDPISYVFRWYVNEGYAQEGPDSTLPTGKFRKGDVVRVEITPSDDGGNGETYATQPLTVGNLPPIVSSVTIEPQNAVLGSPLSAASAASDPDGDALSCEYQWSVNGRVSGPASPNASLQTTGLRKQDIVTVAVVCFDGTAAAGPVVSKPAGFGNSVPVIESSAPDSVVNGVHTYQVAARDPDGDHLEFRLERGPSGMTIDPSTGLIQWTVPKGVMYTGRNEITVKLSVSDGNGGEASQEYMIVLVDYVAY
ncbi:MAG: Ig domain-containing protein [Nitrospirota bacterium]|nr:Ig domain-containing protein [Nitrospirota bacterium]